MSDVYVDNGRTVIMCMKAVLKLCIMFTERT